jgi:hypothetical protein
MNEKAEGVTWPELAMYLVAGIAGAALGILAALWMKDAVAAESPFFWFVTRASAIVAYLLLWLSTAWGVTISSKGIGGRISGVLAYAMHNITSWLALGFSLVHALSLFGEASVPFTAAGIFVPFLVAFLVNSMIDDYRLLGMYLVARRLLERDPADRDAVAFTPAHQGGFPCSILAQQRGDRTRPYSKGNVIQCCDVGKPLRDLMKREWGTDCQ